MAPKKSKEVTIPNPKSGESWIDYYNRIMLLQPKIDYRFGADDLIAQGIKISLVASDIREQMYKYYPVQFTQFEEEQRAYDEAYATGRKAATPTTIPPTTAPPTTRPPTTMPPTTVPTSSMPPTTRPVSTSVPPSTPQAPDLSSNNRGMGGAPGMGGIVGPPITTPPTTVPTIKTIIGGSPPSTTTDTDAPAYKPPPRYAKDNQGKWYVYDGAGIVDAAGKISDKYYDTSNEPGIIYAKLTPAERLEILNKLNDSGFYTGGTVGNYASDLNAISALLEYSNNAGISREVALNQIVTSGVTAPPTKTGGPPRTYRTSNTDDLKVMAKKISQDTLGRTMSDEELSRFADSYQKSEIDYQKSVYAGGTVEEMPDANVAAQEFSQELAPTEANAYKYLGYVDKFFNSIGGVS